MASDIQRRKDDHLDLCATDDVAFRKATNLLAQVQLVHQSLPDLALADLDTTSELLGKTLRFPMVIAAMTGGTERAAQVNRDLASIAQARGYGFGLGSQRAMQRNPETAWTYQVRDWAPDALVLGNVGVVQARELQTPAIEQMLGDIGADALCVHMNPAQELVQPEGDRDFRGGTETMRRLSAELSLPVVAKETGCGISRETATKLWTAGVRHVDVSGAGGTSWVGVETLRADGDQVALGERLWDWGVPTAAAVHFSVEAGLQTIATGGVKTGLEVAQAVALGATAVGMARPLLQAHVEGGRVGAEQLLERVEQEFRTVMLLCGAGSLAALRGAPRLIGAGLQAWMDLAPSAT